MQGGSPTKMTKKQIAELREAFDLFDLDKDGRITSSELRTVMTKLRQKVTPAEVDNMIHKVDIDGNGTIEFEEFLQMMTQRLSDHAHASDEVRLQREEAEARQAFNIFDIDGDGLIDANELRLTMENLGEKLTEADVRAMILAADKNGDGKVDFQEFVSVMRQK